MILISGYSKILELFSEGTNTKASLFIDKPRGSKYSEISKISFGFISLIYAPLPADGQLPATITLPPVIPIPGSLPTEPKTIIVPHDMPAPTLSPA